MVASGILVKNTLLEDFKAANPGKSDAEISVADLPLKNPDVGISFEQR